MLKIHIKAGEFWDSVNNEFVYTKETDLQLEHSLISLTKWEQKYKRPFLTKGPSTIKETIDYFKCMCINKNVNSLVFENIDKENYDKILAYIQDPMTATTITEHSNKKGKGNNEVLTSEVIYYYMTALNIPFECEKWHLNNLLMLIKVASAKNNPKKMSRGETLKNNRELNKARRAALHSKG